MPARIRLAAILAAAILALTAAASAQNAAGSTQAAPPPSQQQTLRQLEQQAARLTLVARLPEADRTQATQLLGRQAALRQRARALRIQELQSYVDALKAGTAPDVARVQAQQQVSDQRLSLTKDMAAFRSDVQAFLQKVPQARALLRGMVARAGSGEPAGRGWLPGTGSAREPAAGAPGAGPSGPHGGMMPWRNGRWGGQEGPGTSRWYGPWSAPGMRPGRNGPWSAPGMRPEGNGPATRWGPGAGMPWGWQQRNGPGSQNGTQNGTPQNGTPQNGGGTGM